jgi:hypothetical protein
MLGRTQKRPTDHEQLMEATHARIGIPCPPIGRRGQVPANARMGSERGARAAAQRRR